MSSDESFSSDEAEIEQERDPLRDLTKVLNAVDRFEDEFEDRAYEELVPLQIKLALEDKVFGWSNLASSIIGHVVITGGAYALTYFALCLIPWELHDPHTTRTVRVVASVSTAVSAYRMVRRRRHVWLRAPYGSKHYLDDDKRRQKAVAESDASTLLGRIRRRRDIYLHGRLQKKLSQAEVRFDSWKQRYSPLKKRRPSFQTFPVNETTSIENDQVCFAAGHIKNMPYSHGCFFGAAPFMLANPDWITILRSLLPDVYVEISRRVVHAPAQKLIHWAENNPVVAAYGTANELGNSGKIVNLEWDVFLDPQLVRRVELVLEQRENFIALNGSIAENWTHEQRSIKEYLDAELERRSSVLVDKMLIAHGKLSQLLLECSGYAKDYIYSRVQRTRRTLGGGMYARQWMAVYSEALKLGLQMGESFSELADEGSSFQEEDEPDFNMEALKESLTKSESCPLLAEAEKESISEEKKRPALAHSERTANKPHTCLTSLSSSKCPDSSIKESVKLLKRVTRKERPIGLVLDMKSRHVPKRVWSIVVNKLNAAGARVEGIASFTIDEIRDISRFCVSPVVEIIFCHAAGDMQLACHDGSLKYGDTVFLNGGSLLYESPKIDTEYLYNLFCGQFDSEFAMKGYSLLPHALKEDRGGRSTIKGYRDRMNLKIGIYVQEFGIDEAALNMLVKYVNNNPDIFEHGFSWGGINGVTVRGIRPARWTSTDGLHTQRLCGLSWDPMRFPDEITVNRPIKN
mmetsp:Transcript_18871/g.31190  ORF Transcript_18871/g.31190 Transcript_18871/m.31190 type:complete len:745 (-) Transcript_18871:168-2402(-)|eukprot:CAMPEP_0119012176 /NCGR_PEP_ID=MMETSP1176-20130426/6126_1 /TAXON_ID=265551 /ORGANISM="Synedropsis recta cf, Strain CCMP1620" /LENGTH=744 /DNA_ID=CAMNT_0006965095 /DNA_START=130 /DNA_END=2364 /DNA_ORIENTATION=-